MKTDKAQAIEMTKRVMQLYTNYGATLSRTDFDKLAAYFRKQLSYARKKQRRSNRRTGKAGSNSSGN